MLPLGHVAVFKTKFLPNSETFIHDELRHHINYKVTVLTKKHLNENLFPGHHVISLRDHSKLSKLENFIFNKWFYSWTFNREFLNRKIDIIHAHFATGGVYMMGFAKKFDIPLVVTLHGKDVTLLISEEIKRPRWRFFRENYKRLFDTASLFLAASQELKDIVVSAGCPKEKVIEYRLGIDLSKFSPAKVDLTAPPKVIMIGRLVEKKGFEFGVRAFAKVIHQGIAATLHIIGDGPLRDQLERVAVELGVYQKLHFEGLLSHDHVVSQLKTSSILLAPSVVAENQDRDSGLITAKEASACSIPVIGSIHGGIPDIVEDGKTGFLVKEKDVDGLSARLTSLLKDENLRTTLGNNGRKKMEAEYDNRRCNERLEAIYDSLKEKPNRK